MEVNGPWLIDLPPVCQAITILLKEIIRESRVKIEDLSLQFILRRCFGVRPRSALAPMSSRISISKFFGGSANSRTTYFLLPFAICGYKGFKPTIRKEF